MDESLIKSFTSLEQSKKLAKILPLESAGMFYYRNAVLKEVNPRVMNYSQVPELQSMYYSPCWSLAALLDVLRVYGFKPILDLKDCSIQYSGIDYFINITASNPIDACYETIIALNKLKIL